MIYFLYCQFRYNPMLTQSRQIVARETRSAAPRSL
jgi:hypothetical protein